MIEIDLVSHLKSDSNVTDLIGSRLYPEVAPQNVAKPYLTYKVVNNAELQSLNHREPYGERALIQIDCWADSFSSAVTTRAVVQDSMHSFDKKAYNLYTMSDYEPETKLFRQIIQFNI